MNEERNLLFGVLAVQQGKAAAGEVVRVAKGLEESGSQMGQAMVAQGLLSPEDCKTIESLVNEALANHEGDAGATLGSLQPEPRLAEQLAHSLFGEDLEKAPGSLFGPGGTSIFQSKDSGNTATVAGQAPMPDTGLPQFAEPASLQGASLRSDAATVAMSDEGLSKMTDRTDAATVMSEMPLHTVQPGKYKSQEYVPAVQEHQGRYEEIKEFAKGGMGRILLVHDVHFGRDIALKQLLPGRFKMQSRHGSIKTSDLLTTPIIARFLQEARVNAQLEHPSIVPVYELGYRTDGSLYYTMKLVRGQDLQKILGETKGLSERLALLNHFLNLCYAISYAHSRGVVHRDLKPLNVMIGEFGETVLIDWGIAKVKGAADIHASDLKETVRALTIGDAEATAKTMYGQTMGSPYYMPPEQAAGRTDEVDERSDIYALGAILYVLLCGQPPYHGNNVREFLDKVQNVPPKPIKQIEPDAPPELVAVCDRAMARDPKQRYQTAKELTEEIRKFLSGGLVSAYEYRFYELFKRFVKRHKAVLSTASAAALALLVLGVYSYIRVSNERDFALEQEAIAQTERANAEAARDQAVVAEEAAVVARDDARAKLYRAKIALTPNAIDDQQMKQARAHLEEAPAEYRNWEWGHLQARANADTMTIPAGGQFAAFTADGNALILGDTRGRLELRDAATGELRSTLVEDGGRGTVYAASAGGARVAVRTQSALIVFDTASAQRLFQWEDPNAKEERKYLALSADGARVVTVGGDKVARVWDVGTDAPIREFDGQGARSIGAYLSPDGSRVLLTREVFGDEGWERGFEVVEAATGTALGKHLFTGEQSALSVHAAAFSRDNARLALGTDAGLLLWSAASGKIERTLQARFNRPDTMAFSPDGAKIAAGDIDGNVGLWEVATGEGNRIAKAHSDLIYGIAFSAQGDRVATVAADRTVRLWEVPTLRALRVFRGHEESVFAAAFHPEGAALASSSFGGSTKIWDLGAELEFAPITETAVYHPESGRVAGALGNAVGLWDAKSGHRLATLEGHTAAVKLLEFDPAGGRLASQANERGDSGAADVIRVWDTASGTETQRFTLGTGTQDIRFVSDGRTLLTRAGTTVRVLDTESGAEIRTMPETIGFAASRAGGLWASASNVSKDDPNARTVRVWRGAEEAPTLEIPVQAKDSCRLWFHPDKPVLVITTAVGAPGVVHLWDLDAAQPLHVLEGHENWVTCVAFSADGARLATGSRDRSVRIWDLASGQTAVTIPTFASELIDITFNRDGSRLVTASRDGAFRVFDAADGNEIVMLQSAVRTAAGDVVLPRSVQFSPDERQLVTLTRPPFAPYVLHAFPWKAEDYPGASDAPLQERIEAYKRSYWR